MASSWLKSFNLRPTDQRYALLEACSIGFISAIAAVILKEGIGWLGTFRLQAADTYGGWLALPFIGFSCGFLAGICVETFAPDAGGGGIPNVKAVLARYPLPLSLRVAVVKIVGTILVLGGGLTLGRRGPTVHVGAALAAQLSQWVPTSPEHRRQLIAAGAAAGLAAGFNTPIAGIFFVVEELMRDVSGLTLETAILASFTGAVVSRLFGADLGLPRGEEANYQTSFELNEIPFFLLLALVAGILGVLFNRGILWSVGFNRRLGWSLPWRIAIAGLISGTVISMLPLFRNNAGLRDVFLAPEGDWQTTLVALVVHFLLTLLAYGSGAPGGLFAPALAIGAALGDLVGIAQVSLAGIGSEATYIFVGMAAFFTAVVRVPVTAIIIIFELTADFNLVLPLMVVSVVSYVVAETLSPGSLYQHLLAIKGIQLNDETGGDSALARLTAADVMQMQVDTLSCHLTLDEVRQAFLKSHHRGFPVLDDRGKLVGTISQVDVARLSTHAGSTPIREIVTPRPLTIAPTAPLTEALYLLNRYLISHLPVLDGDRLVGIITRGDIIRTEARLRFQNDISLGTEAFDQPQNEPSYAVYQTRSPALGKGRLLLPLANPKTAPILLHVGAAIARARESELECLQVIGVPRHRSPARTWVESDASRELLQKAERTGRDWEVSVHTQVRVAHDIAHTIVEAIAERQISLLVMGWRGRKPSPGRIFGSIVDTIIQQALCDVVLLKWGNNAERLTAFEGKTRWLIPVAGGPNTRRAIDMLGALSAWTPNPEFWLCQVWSPAVSDPDTEVLEQAAQTLRSQVEAPVTAIPIRAYSVPDAIVKLARAEACDVILIGTSREGLLPKALHATIPEQIANNAHCTVMLVRGAVS